MYLLNSRDRLARHPAGLRVVNFNATPAGGGVAEILRSLVGLMRGVGLDARWYVVDAAPGFSRTTKKLHHCLQGSSEPLSEEEIELYLAHNRREAAIVDGVAIAADLWIMHDPQTLPLLHYLHTKAPAIWVCHVDTTRPNEQVRNLVIPYIRHYQRALFSLPHYVLDGMGTVKVSIVPPAIDPLIPKNRAMSKDQAREVLARLGIDTSRPLVTQVSRFDRWKDPWGVIDAYPLARKEVPGLQLALVGVMTALDDPDAVPVFHSVQEHAGNDGDIHLFADPEVVGDVEVNAFQSGSDVMVQKSIREGFGLTVAETMWKGTPVVGGDCGGIRLQIRDGETGFLVADALSCARRIADLVTNPRLARRLGEAGRQSVSRNYLMPRLLRDYLELTAEICRRAPTEGSPTGAAV